MHVLTHGAGHRGQVSALMLFNSRIPARDGFTTYLHHREGRDATADRGVKPMRAASRDYLPAFGKDFLLPFFDQTGMRDAGFNDPQTISNSSLSIIHGVYRAPFEFPGKLFTSAPHSYMQSLQ